MRKTRKRSRKVNGGKCPCAAASKLPITFGGVRRNRNKTRKNKNKKRVRFA
jgi:hypothetical protein